MPVWALCTRCPFAEDPTCLFWRCAHSPHKDWPTHLRTPCLAARLQMSANLDLADELLEAASSAQGRSNLPQRSPAVTSVEQT